MSNKALANARLRNLTLTPACPPSWPPAPLFTPNNNEVLLPTPYTPDTPPWKPLLCCQLPLPVNEFLVPRGFQVPARDRPFGRPLLWSTEPDQTNGFGVTRGKFKLNLLCNWAWINTRCPANKTNRTTTSFIFFLSEKYPTIKLCNTIN